MINIQLDKAYTCLSSNNFCLAIGGKGGVSVINHKQEITQIHANECHTLSFSSSELLAVCNDKIVEIYDGQSKIWGSEKHVRRILDVDWNSAGLLATCSKDSKLYAWDPRMPEPAIVFAPTKGVGVHCLAWSRHSNDIIASGHETALKIWDARLPKKSVGTVRSAHPGRIIGLDWHHNSNILLSNSLLSLVKTWKTTAVSISVVNSTQTHFQSIKTLFSPDDSRIVYTSENNDGKIHFLNTEDLKVHLSSNMGSSVEDLDWHGDSLAVLCADRVLKIIGFENKENNDRGEMIEDFQEGDAFDCSMTIMNFEEEIKCMESNPKEGIFIENYGLGQRFCLIRIHNKKEFLKYMLNFPIDYPDFPPTYMLQASSKYLSTSAPEEIKRLETDLVKRSKKLCKAKGFSIQKICDYLLSQLNSITDIEGYEDFNDFLENILDYPSYPKNTPLTCIHAWHPSGDLLVFISSESTNNYAFEDIFDIESSHYQAGIQ